MSLVAKSRKIALRAERAMDDIKAVGRDEIVRLGLTAEQIAAINSTLRWLDGVRERAEKLRK